MSDLSSSIFHFAVFDEKKMYPHVPLVNFKKVIPAMSQPMAHFQLHDKKEWALKVGAVPSPLTHCSVEFEKQ